MTIRQGDTLVAGIIGKGLPPQEGHNGKYLKTDGTDASWDTINALQNTATGNNALTILGTPASMSYAVNVGTRSNARMWSTAIGEKANANGFYSVAIGSSSGSLGENSIAIGSNSYVDGENSIQIGNGNNFEANSLKVAIGSNNYKLLGSDGNIPIERLSGNITNCITYVPQDIKLELSNGTLTLKSGSKVYVPNGSGVFTAVTLANDISRSTFGTQTGTNCIIECIYSSGNITAITWSMLTNTASGTATPTSGIYYRTDTNYINSYSSGSVVDQRSFPIALVTMSSGVVQSIDQVFNGFGYIGSTVFALPGVKGLIPNGRNADGSLKNIEVLNNSVKTFSRENLNGYIGFMSNAELNYDDTSWWKYNSELNLFTHNEQRFSFFQAIRVTTDSSGKITSFTPKTTFHALDYNDFKSVVDTKAGLSSNNTFTGVNTFGNNTHLYIPFLVKQNSDKEGGQIFFDSADNEPNAGKNIFIDRYDGKLRIIGDNSSGNPCFFNIDIQNDSIEATPGVKSSIVGWGMPNYSSGITVSQTDIKGTGFVAPKDGIFIGTFGTSASNGWIYINNMQVQQYGGSNNTHVSVTLPLNKNDVLRIDSTSLGSTTALNFYPLKGVA